MTSRSALTSRRVSATSELWSLVTNSWTAYVGRSAAPARVSDSSPNPDSPRTPAVAGRYSAGTSRHRRRARTTATGDGGLDSSVPRYVEVNSKHSSQFTGDKRDERQSQWRSVRVWKPWLIAWLGSITRLPRHCPDVDDNPNKKTQTYSIKI